MGSSWESFKSRKSWSCLRSTGKMYTSSSWRSTTSIKWRSSSWLRGEQLKCSHMLCRFVRVTSSKKSLTHGSAWSQLDFSRSRGYKTLTTWSTSQSSASCWKAWSKIHWWVNWKDRITSYCTSITDLSIASSSLFIGHKHREIWIWLSTRHWTWCRRHLLLDRKKQPILWVKLIWSNRLENATWYSMIISSRFYSTSDRKFWQPLSVRTQIKVAWELDSLSKHIKVNLFTLICQDQYKINRHSNHWFKIKIRKATEVQDKEM